MVPVPGWLFGVMARRDVQRMSGRRPLTPDQRRVQHFVVREIAHRREPIAPGDIATALGLSDDRVREILDELERRMTFLYRAGGDDVVWAYPVTAAATPHQIRIDGGAAFSAA
jgi:hypothetical protein